MPTIKETSRNTYTELGAKSPDVPSNKGARGLSSYWNELKLSLHSFIDMIYSSKLLKLNHWNEGSESSVESVIKSVTTVHMGMDIVFHCLL